ncbi:hypothetical protein [Extensimonas vulgaris]|uniref:Tetratricopeptide repeat protein n=1 Tax=Extensimonas vulgaris TaxID=1031594 RepID=A0A369AL67_9BURK|nr:hypothetical protein [Extensimonas vulgaris]RCX10112.1 hypothetical protein DFR45_10396 [Extensimonas vulgaris]TWI39693.1 hypothetical protein IP95_00923 [Extensimonas vulgaris]TXD17262.1 hypothetical protein FUT63_00485 [Extensimonas vulgaris]
MAQWTPFPYSDLYRFDPARLKQLWPRLHAGDAEPYPSDEKLQHAWLLLHSGQFQEAAELGQRLGGAGLTVANKATALYANYLEPSESARQDLLLQVAERAQAQAADAPDNPNAWFWRAYALARYGQSISVAKAVAQGLGNAVKESLQKTLALAPQHAHAHIALGAFDAEVIDKLGPLVGQMTFGAKKETALAHLRQGLALHPQSTIGLIEYANALMMLEGEPKMDEATRLYEQAAAIAPLDAAEHLDVELARAELEG